MEIGTYWRELEDSEGFLSIVRLLIECDEKEGRHLRFTDPAAHYMRKAISLCRPDDVRVFVKHAGAFVYNIVVQASPESGVVATAWTHDDGIMQERVSFAKQKAHPVHGIPCLTDYYEQAKEWQDLDGAGLTGPALDMLTGAD